MMTRRWMLIVAGVLFAVPTAGAAQGGQGGGMATWQMQTVADLEQMRDKFLSLAEAFPEETWAWAPMEGTRSVRDVMVLMVAEGNVFPGMWGAAPPSGGASNFGAEIGRVTPMSKDDVIREMEGSLNYMIEALRNLTPELRRADADWFGQATNGVGIVGFSVRDMHEHLGQSIAYARMNQIVPPWSQ